MTERSRGAGPARWHRLVAVLAALAAALAPVAFDATPAGAHAQVTETSPGDGEQLDRAPTSVTVSFSEPVQTELGGLKVFDADGAQVDDGALADNGSSISIGLAEEVADGTYVVTYQVVSSDGHPISGSFAFGVGEPADVAVDAGSFEARAGTPWDVLGGVARFLSYAGALACAGLALFLVAVHGVAGAAASSGTATARRLAWLGAAAALAGQLGWLVTHGALATGAGLDGAADLDVLREVAGGPLGRQALVLGAGLALALVVLARREQAWARPASACAVVVTAVAFVLWGHATESSPRALAIGADALHLGVAVVWVGGLVGLTALLRSRHGDLEAGAGHRGPAPDATEGDSDGSSGGPSGTGRLLAPPAPAPSSVVATGVDADVVTTTALVVRRFSALATATVPVLWLAGLTLALIELEGDVGELFSSSYGRLVLAKVALTALVLVPAGYNRFVLVGRVGAPAADAPERWRDLRRAVAIELCFLLGVLGVTGALVQTPPPAQAAAAPGDVAGGVFDETLPFGVDQQVQLVVTPGSVGPNTMHLSFYDAAGVPVEAAQGVVLEMSLPEAGIAPIEREMVRLATGHYTLDGSQLAPAGTWTIEVVARVSDFEDARTAFAVPIGG
jgi:copper transport protein